MKTLCIFLFVSTAVFASSIPLKIEKIDFQKRSQGMVAALQLSNHTVWNIFLEPENVVLMQTIRNEFEIGCSVMVRAQKYDPILLIGRPESSKSFRAGMTAESKKALPKFEGVRQIVIEPGGWFSDPKYGCNLYLSDGSVWKRDYLGNVKFWKKGDTILVSHQYDDGDFSLINLDENCESQFTNGKTYDTRLSYWFADRAPNNN